MAKLPYPPAPELGWYSDDPVEGTPDSAVGTAEPQNDYGQPSTAEAATNTAFTAEPAATAAAAEPAATLQHRHNDPPSVIVANGYLSG